MVTLVHFCSSGSMNSNLFQHLFDFEKTWRLQTVFTTAVNLLPGVNFWLSLLLRFGNLYFHLQAIIHKSKFQQGLTFCKFWFLWEMFPCLHVSCLQKEYKTCLYSQGHGVSAHDRMVIPCKLFYLISGWNLHNVSIRVQCEAPLIKLLSCQPSRERMCFLVADDYLCLWNRGNLSHSVSAHVKCKIMWAGKDVRRSLFHPSAQRRVNIWDQTGL